MPTLARNKHFSIFFLTHRPRTGSVSEKKFVKSLLITIIKKTDCKLSRILLYRRKNYIPATELRNFDSLEQTFESKTDTETTNEPMQHPPSVQSDPPLTIKINDPTSKDVLEDDLCHSRGGKNYSEMYRYWCVQKSIFAPWCALFLAPSFSTHLIILGGGHTNNNEHTTISTINKIFSDSAEIFSAISIAICLPNPKQHHPGLL